MARCYVIKDTQMKKVLFILACLVITCPAKADFTGADLQSACTNNQDICDFWITSSLLGAFGSQASQQAPVSCTPGGTTRAQARLIVEKYMHDHPENLHLPAQDIVLAASQLAFPCTKFAPMMPMPPEK
jgi:Rap1a immunity proteins